MRDCKFGFLRATFYRWVQRFNKDESAKGAPRLLAVGDLHVENYGTWRDAEGRLIWGINDFDEAAVMPYTNDLIRLATSMGVAISTGHLGLDLQTACEAILDGYRASLETKGRPFVLEADHPWLRRIATGVERSPDHFWQKLTSTQRIKAKPTPEGLTALNGALPTPIKPKETRTRVAGLGSLGHPRYLAIVDYDGGYIAREAKLLAPSSVYWVAGRPGERMYSAIVDRAVRCKDPFLTLHEAWVVRRLAPSCSRIELSDLPAEREEEKLAHAMGFELGNIHLASPKAILDVLKHLESEPKKWLRKATDRMSECLEKDYETFKKNAESQ